MLRFGDVRTQSRSPVHVRRLRRSGAREPDEARVSRRRDLRDGGGGSEEHSALAAEVLRAFGNAIGERPCRVHTSDLRIYVEAAGLATFPDGSVICGPAASAEPQRHRIEPHRSARSDQRLIGRVRHEHEARTLPDHPDAAGVRHRLAPRTTCHGAPSRGARRVNDASSHRWRTSRRREPELRSRRGRSLPRERHRMSASASKPLSLHVRELRCRASGKSNDSP
jgi:hypothetical protein